MSEQTQTQLRQLENSVEIIGTLKSKELEVKTSKKGNKFMSGNLVLVCKIGDKIHEHKVKIFIMEKAKNFKGIETVKNEYKTIEANGLENADRIKVTGELTLNEYYDQGGNLKQFNEVKGLFFTRLEGEEAAQPDKALASIETVVEGFTPVMKDNLPTGDYAVKGFTVAWGNEVVEFKKAVIGTELAQAFMNLYQPGQTGRLTFALNNYVLVEERVEVVPTAVSHGFGSTEKVEGNAAKKYVNNIEIIGGDLPFMAPKEYTTEEIQTAKQVRALKLQELQQPAPEVPQTNNGFGQGAPAPGNPSPYTPAQVNNQLPFGMNGEMPKF